MEEFLMWALGIALAMLLALLAWIGSRVHDRLDQINNTLIKIDADLTDKISKHDVRLTAIEVELKLERRKDDR